MLSLSANAVKYSTYHQSDITDGGSFQSGQSQCWASALAVCISELSCNPYSTFDTMQILYRTPGRGGISNLPGYISQYFTVGYIASLEVHIPSVWRSGSFMRAEFFWNISLTPCRGRGKCTWYSRSAYMHKIVSQPYPCSVFSIYLAS